MKTFFLIFKFYTMTISQQARFKAYALSLAHLRDNETITQEVPAIGTLYNMAKAAMDAIESADKRRSEKLGGVTENKYQLQDDLANQATLIASAIGAYALLRKDMELKEAMNFTRSELFYGANQSLTTKCANILAKARELGAALKDFGITDALLERLASVMEQYAGNMHQPRNMAAERKVAGMQVAELLKQLHVIFTEQLDALMLFFKFSRPEFYQEYKAKRSIVSPAYRKTRVEGMVKDKHSKAALPNVTVTVKGSEQSATTATDGSYNLQTAPQPAATLLFEKEGYKPVEVNAELLRGKAAVYDIVLESE